MKLFPDRLFDEAGSYIDAYFEQLEAAQKTVDRKAVAAVAKVLNQAILEGRSIFSCGNGGAAAISNHLLCDYLKGICTGTHLKPRVHTLSSNVELITAVGNDIGFEDIFSMPLGSLGKAGDILIAISSSGSSPNILKALDTASDLGMTTIAMTGFGGGDAARRADFSLHVASENYGVVEDTHQSLMHALAQYLRQGSLVDPSTLGSVRF